MTEEQIAAFQELIAGMNIQQLRIYDMLSIISYHQNPQKTDELIELHKSGKVLCPDPALVLED